MQYSLILKLVLQRFSKTYHKKMVWIIWRSTRFQLEGQLFPCLSNALYKQLPWKYQITYRKTSCWTCKTICKHASKQCCSFPGIRNIVWYTNTDHTCYIPDKTSIISQVEPNIQEMAEIKIWLAEMNIQVLLVIYKTHKLKKLCSPAQVQCLQHQTYC